MQSYMIVVDASNFYNGPKTMKKKAKDLSNLRKNLVKEFGDGSASVVKIKVYKDDMQGTFLGTLSMIITSRDFQPIWTPADRRIPAKAISRNTGRRL